MADKKISQLTNITGANLADTDEFVVVDTSATETKAITWAELKEGLDTSTGFVRITGDTMTGDLTVQANIAVTGTVDGRDVAADGTKLDGIEAGATADQTKADIDALGIDAATLDGVDSTGFATAAQGTLADSAVQPGDLATVATTGAYSDLSGTPTLGTAAATDSTDYATAAQGALADSAVQPADLATVATTGAYSDLSGTPTLGTAAAADTTDFDPAGTALALAIALG